jgi:integrase
MKMRREHKKPLPKLAIEILSDLKRATGQSEFAFLSNWSTGKPISENTLNGALRRLGFTKEQATSHGFRSSASSLLNESRLWSPDAIEAELAHVGADQVRRAYNRTLYWDERVRMADWWAGEILGMLGKCNLTDESRGRQ